MTEQEFKLLHSKLMEASACQQDKKDAEAKLSTLIRGSDLTISSGARRIDLELSDADLVRIKKIIQSHFETVIQTTEEKFKQL